MPSATASEIIDWNIHPRHASDKHKITNGHAIHNSIAVADTARATIRRAVKNKNTQPNQLLTPITHLVNVGIGFLLQADSLVSQNHNTVTDTTDPATI